MGMWRTIISCQQGHHELKKCSWCFDQCPESTVGPRGHWCQYESGPGREQMTHSNWINCKSWIKSLFTEVWAGCRETLATRQFPGVTHSLTTHTSPQACKCQGRKVTDLRWRGSVKRAAWLELSQGCIQRSRGPQTWSTQASVPGTRASLAGRRGSLWEGKRWDWL